jgi:hypothetical protein
LEKKIYHATKKLGMGKLGKSKNSSTKQQKRLAMDNITMKETTEPTL